MAAETRDILALATAFRQPPTEGRLLEYLGLSLQVRPKGQPPTLDELREEDES